MMKKLKKLILGLVTLAAMAVLCAVCAVCAEAELYLPDEYFNDVRYEFSSGGCQLVIPVFDSDRDNLGTKVDYGINFEDIAGVRAVIYAMADESDTTEFEGNFGGSLVLNYGNNTSGSYWNMKTFWGLCDAELDIMTTAADQSTIFEKIDSYTYQATSFFSESERATSDSYYVQIAIQQWGNDACPIKVLCLEALNEAGEVIISFDTYGNYKLGESFYANPDKYNGKNEDKFTYEENDDGTLTITDYDATTATMIIPSEIDGKTVTAIAGNMSEYDYDYMTNVVIIPDTLKDIGYSGFSNFRVLKIFKVAPNNLYYYDLVGSLFSKDTNALIRCPSLREILYLPAETESIILDRRPYGEYYSPISTCSILKSIIVDDENEYLSSYDGILYDKNQTKLIYCPKGKSDEIEFPSTLVEIGENSFSIRRNSMYKSISIPEGVKKIDGEAFFYNSIESIILPDSLEEIGEGAFDYCTNLSSITIPDGVTIIDNSAFFNCTSLTSITIPDSVTIIGGDAFYGCSGLTSITIPDSVTDMGSHAFNGTPFLENQTTAVKYAGKWAVDCDRDEVTVTIKNGTVGIAAYAFYDFSKLTSVAIPDSVTSIGDGAFCNCSGLTSITIPKSVTSIGNYTFYSCDNLTIYCYTGTAGETYAKDNGFDYVLLDEPPASVTGFTLGGRAADALRLNWTKNTSADGYIIEKYDGTKWVRVAKITNNSTTTYRVTGLSAGTAYKFRMRAYKMNGSTAFYSDYTATLAARTNPSNVTGLKLGGRAYNALRLNWTKNTSADGYIIEMYKNNAWVRVAKIAGNATTTYRVTGLSAGTAYKFRIKAYKMDGSTAVYSAYTSTLTATTSPSVVKGLTLGGRAYNALRLNWTKNTSADGYIIEMYKNNAWVRVAKITSNATTTYRVTGLSAGTAYKFRMKAYKMSGSTAFYSGYTATLSARTNPSNVTGVKIGGKASNALRVNWTKNTSADGYIVEIYKGGKWVRAAKITNNATVTYRISGLAKNTTYQIRIKAYKMSGTTALYSGYTTISGKTTA